MKTKIVTPFFKNLSPIAALTLGVLTLFVTAEISYYSKLILDGVLDIHIGPTTAVQAAELTLINSLGIIFGVGGLALFFDRHFSAFKLIGTLFIARLPFFICALAAFMVEPNFNTVFANPQTILDMPGLIAFGIISIVMLIIYFRLTYLALRESTSIAHNRLVLVTIIGLLTAEVISKFLIFYIY